MTKSEADIEAIIEQLSVELHEIMQSFASGEEEYASLVRTNLVRILIMAVIQGYVKVDKVKESLDLLCAKIRDRSLQVNEVIDGILAIDNTARRVALSVSKDRTFRYSSQRNLARELLLSFANSLNR